MESSDIFLPEYQNSTSCLVISSVSTGKPDAIIDQKAVVSAAENFYVSENNIYISNTNWSSDVTMTQILKFSCQKGKIQAKGAADLKGSLNDSFSMNEYNSYLRVVLTDYSGETQKMHSMCWMMRCRSAETLRSGRRRRHPFRKISR